MEWKKNTEKLVQIGKSAMKGRLQLALGLDKYLGHIVYFFLCAIFFIWFNLQIDMKLHQKVENAKTLENLKSIHTDTICKLTALDSVCEVEKMLKNMGSNVGIPQKQAKVVKNKR